MPTNAQMITVSEQNSGIHEIGEENAFVLDSSCLLYFSPLCRSFQFFLFVSGQNWAILVWLDLFLAKIKVPYAIMQQCTVL